MDQPLLGLHPPGASWGDMNNTSQHCHTERRGNWTGVFWLQSFTNVEGYPWESSLPVSLPALLSCSAPEEEVPTGLTPGWGRRAATQHSRWEAVSMHGRCPPQVNSEGGREPKNTICDSSPGSLLLSSHHVALPHLSKSLPSSHLSNTIHYPRLPVFNPFLPHLSIISCDHPLLQAFHWPQDGRGSREVMALTDLPYLPSLIGHQLFPLSPFHLLFP